MIRTDNPATWHAKYLDMDAKISDDGVYRYWLSRRIGMGERTVAFIGLNPSTADALKDDPTIRRCVWFARTWGFDWLLMANLHALRATNPKLLVTAEDPIGPDNAEYLKWVVKRSEIVVAAWGAHRLHCTAHAFVGWLRSLPYVHCLGTTQGGHPRHPLYISRASSLKPFGNLQP
jgi:hypothetical protein